MRTQSDARPCLSQVPPQESNLNAEQLVPPQVPGRASDGKRYPDPLQDGVDTTVHDPEPRWAEASALISAAYCETSMEDGAAQRYVLRLALLDADRADVVRETLEPVADKISADAALNR